MNNQGEIVVLEERSHPIEKVYLDTNATTPISKEVADSISRCLIDNWYNPSSQYVEGKNAKALIGKARQSIADMINAESQSDIIFVSGGTEANNLVFHSVLQHYNNLKQEETISYNKQDLPHFIISNIEHDSVKLVAEGYEKAKIAEATYVKVGSDGQVNVEDVIASIKPNTVLISLMLANNETGVIQPVKELARRLNELGYNNKSSMVNKSRLCPLYLHTDAAQAIGKIRVDVEDLQVDYLTVVGHKFYGPKIGALYARNCLRGDLNYEISSDMSKNSKKSPIFHMFYGAGQESGLRPGTENTPMIVGLGAAADLVAQNLDKYYTQMKLMRDYLEERLKEEFGVDNLRFNGLSDKSQRLPNTCNVSFISSDKYKGYAILANAKHLEASTGACCHSGECKPSKILLAMGIDKQVASNAVRLSVGRETTRKQIDLAVQDLKDTLNYLQDLKEF